MNARLYPPVRLQARMRLPKSRFHDGSIPEFDAHGHGNSISSAIKVAITALFHDVRLSGARPKLISIEIGLDGVEPLPFSTHTTPDNTASADKPFQHIREAS